MRAFLLLAATCGLSAAAPQWLAHPYSLGYVAPAAAVVTGNSVPVSVGGYKAVAGSNGDLAGPVHEVPGLVPALAVQKQESSGDVSLSTGTGAIVPTVAYYGKREAEADPALVYSAALPYAAYPYAAYPYTYAVKPLTLKSEVVATGAAVPVSVGGYKAVAGDNGDLKVCLIFSSTAFKTISVSQGAVHEVPALFGAPALDTQENSNGGSLTVGTSALVKYSLSKREAEADPAVLYSAYPYAAYPYAYGYGYPYAYGAYGFYG